MSGARRYQNLIVWRLGDQLRVLVFTFTERAAWQRNQRLHSQTEDAINSVCRNIAEGFGCKHKEFARYLQISRRSLNELSDAFRTAHLKGYVTAHEAESVWRLSHRMYPAYAGLIHHLLTTPDPDNIGKTPGSGRGTSTKTRGASRRRGGLPRHRGADMKYQMAYR
jgi:four helix bundle protein